VENRPASGLLIIKTDEDGNPLAGVEFEIRTPDGTLVRPQILAGNQPNTPANSPQLTASGGLVTDSRGRIELNHIEPGVYHIAETRALPGFEIDSTTHVVTVLAGRQEVLTVVNRALGGIFLEKINAFTGEGIFNVEFMVFDHNNQVVGTFFTDNNGIIDFSNILLEGRYTIRETRPAPGFFRDDVPRTIEIRPGQVTRITWENIPYAGQLQIQKVSGDDNRMNGLPAGTPLEGAIFEIFEFRSGNLVDRIVSDHNGMAVSRPLPLGRYFAREVQAPQFYMINPQEIHFDIEFATQIFRVQFPNFSANTGVSINKTGPAEVMQGQEIQYNINRVRNESSIPLTDFFWRDLIPTEAIRVHQLVTGTFSHDVRYRILGTTNTGNEIIIADQLSSLNNNVVELNPSALGLASNEFLVEFTVIFGQVPAGFREVEIPRVIAHVLPETMANLPNGMIFTNRVDIGGRNGTEWVIGNNTHSTTIFRPRTPGRIPQSGF
ncbi:MAG: SpaA isopeptide-forming pilin-related protein, partial [Defluviitaleaceae bacterium]|nr:SpaA isopeptide-forming pilin-related protein [Defluviitaleaceae bacterium]